MSGIRERLSLANNFESYFEADNAEVAMPGGMDTSASRGVGMALATGQAGQPNFQAQIDLKAAIIYIGATKGSAIVAPSSLSDTLKTGLPVYFFGNSDFYAGFAAGYKQLPLPSAWSLVTIATAGVDDLSAYTNVVGLLNKGDLVWVYVNVGTVTNYAFVVLSCKQVAYTTLLTSISSDRFITSGIRYNVTDTSKVAQFDNNLNLIRQTLFGKISSDFISPVSYRNPSNQQVNIIDIFIKKGVDKETVIASMANYDVGSFTLSIFIGQVSKVAAYGSQIGK